MKFLTFMFPNIQLLDNKKNKKLITKKILRNNFSQNQTWSPISVLLNANFQIVTRNTFYVWDVFKQMDYLAKMNNSVNIRKLASFSTAITYNK